MCFAVAIKSLDVKTLLKQQTEAQIQDFSPTIRNMQMDFLTPGFGLAVFLLLWQVGLENRRYGILTSRSFSPFQVNKHLAKIVITQQKHQKKLLPT